MDDVIRMLNALTAGENGAPSVPYTQIPVIKTGDHKYTVILHGPIEYLEAYLPVLELLQTANEDDVITLMMDSPGGRVDVALLLCEAIENTRAGVIKCATGEVMSAMFMIASCPGGTLKVLPSAVFMAHGPSGGMIDKIANVYDQAAAILSITDKMARASRELGMLTEVELRQVIDEKRSVFISGNVMINRLSAHAEGNTDEA